MTFKGFDNIAGLEYQQRVIPCKGCNNLCDVTQIEVEGGKIYHGDKCGKFENAGQKITPVKTPFDAREEILNSYARAPQSGRKTLGLPRVGMFYDMYPFWSTFAEDLDLNLKPSDETSREIRASGLEIANSLAPELCYPFKVAFGHLASLDGKVDYILAPDVIQGFPSKYSECGAETQAGWEGSRACPYIHTFGTLVARNSVIQTPVIRSDLNLREPAKMSAKELTDRFNAAGLKVNGRNVQRAFIHAQEVYTQFKKSLRQEGEKVIATLETPDNGIVVVGRPYSSFDAAMNLGIANKIAHYGFVPIPIDFLPLPSRDLSQVWSNEFSVQGQAILNAAESAKELDLNALLIDFFGCGPNSFIKHFFRRQFGRPFLTLQLDEHSADAGMITRLEASLDSIKDRRKG